MLRLIHTRRSSLRFLQLTASTQRYEISYLPVETQLSAADSHRKHSYVNGALHELRYSPLSIKQFPLALIKGSVSK